MSWSRNAGDARQIVQNAGWLYFRLGIKTFADLLLVRLVVGSLGVSGFGVYAAVAGVVSLVFFLQWSVELTVRRFISVALNERDERPVAEAFSAVSCAHGRVATEG